MGSRSGPRPAGDDHAGRVVQPAFGQFEAEETAALEGAGHDQMPRLVREEAETLVIFGIADEQDRAMAALLGFSDRRAHQGGADTLALAGGIDRKRPKQQRCHRPAEAIDAGLDMPQPHGCDDLAPDIAGDERQAFGGKPPLAQLFRRLAPAVRPHGPVEQGFPRRDVVMRLAVDQISGRRGHRAHGIENSGHVGLLHQDCRHKRSSELSGGKTRKRGSIGIATRGRAMPEWPEARPVR